jgi:hypothetical protein
MFKKKKVFIVPDKEVLDLLKILDKINSSNQEYAVSKYLFWTKIEELFPETKIGKWHSLLVRATQLQIIEGIK